MPVIKLFVTVLLFAGKLSYNTLLNKKLKCILNSFQIMLIPTVNQNVVALTKYKGLLDRTRSSHMFTYLNVCLIITVKRHAS